MGQAEEEEQEEEEEEEDLLAAAEEVLMVLVVDGVVIEAQTHHPHLHMLVKVLALIYRVASLDEDLSRKMLWRNSNFYQIRPLLPLPL